MDTLAWIQIISLIIVCLALAVNTYQVWHARQQTVASQRAADSAVTAGQADARNSVLYGDPELLAWFLTYRNCAGSTPLENKKRLFITQKLPTAEAVYLSYRHGSAHNQPWNDWAEAVKADILVDEARLIWPKVRYLYAEEFAKYVDRIIRNFEIEQPIKAIDEAVDD